MGEGKYKIIRKSKLVGICNAIRKRYNEEEKYDLKTIVSKIQNIPQVVLSKKLLFDLFHTQLVIFYRETNESYVIFGMLHANRVVEENNIIRVPVLKNSLIKLNLKSKSIEDKSNQYGTVIYKILRKEIKPSELDNSYLSYDGEEKHDKSESFKIEPILKVEFKGTELGYSKRYKQELENGSDYYKYHQNYTEWFDPEDGYTFWVDDEKITPLWQTPPSDSPQAETPNENRFDHVIYGLENKEHVLYIFNKDVKFEYLPPFTFAGWEQISRVVIPDCITTLGEGCFKDSSLKEVRLSSSVVNIGHSCFMQSKIEKIILPSDLTYVPDFCFKNCTSLKEVVIPANVMTLGINCFDGCNNLKTVIMEPAKPPLGDGALIGLNIKKVTFVVPDDSLVYYTTRYPNIKVLKYSNYKKEGVNNGK